MSFETIDPTQVAAEAPIDDELMGDVKGDLDDLDSRMAAATEGPIALSVYGRLSGLVTKLPIYRADTFFVTTGRTLSSVALVLELFGISGTIDCDVRKYRPVAHGIQQITAQYSDSINSIALAGSAANTQSITKAVTQQATQSITVWKATINVSSIIQVPGTNQWRYNLASAPDADWKIGDSVLFGSCTTGGNNGTFTIGAINLDGGNNITVTNASGAAQTGAAGTAQLQAFSYNLTNPAPAGFVAGESAVFASHTTGANNGTFAIYKTNQGGNNIIVKNATGATQGGVVGTIDSAHWQYNFSSPAGADLVAGELASMASHSTGANNGNFTILAVNSGGNNVVVYNPAGVAQGGVAGTVNSNRWIYTLASDPASSFSVSDQFVATGCTSGVNNGTFPVVQIDRGGGANFNLVVVNTSGAAQGGAAGTATHVNRILKLAADQSAIYSTKSRIIMRGLPDSTYNYPTEFKVVQVNRGGGSNFNVVIANAAGATQASPVGSIVVESKSVFTSRPSISNGAEDLSSTTTATFDGTEAAVPDNTVIGLDVLSLPSGSQSAGPINLRAQLS